MRTILAFLLIVSFFAFPSLAQELSPNLSKELFRWVDGNGVTQYATSLYKIPERFRASAVLLRPDSSPSYGAKKSEKSPKLKQSNSASSKPHYASLASTRGYSAKGAKTLLRSTDGYPKIKLSSSDFHYFPYLVMFKRLVEEEWEYPVQSRLMGEKGNLKLLISLNKRGKVVDVELKKSTKYEMLNAEVLRAVEEAGPYPSIPVEWGASGVKIEAEFNYVLDHWWQKKNVTVINTRTKEPTFKEIRSAILAKIEKRAVVNDVKINPN